MRFSTDFTSASYIIKAYSKGTVRINEIDYHQSVILSQDQLILPSPINSIADLSEQHIQQMLSLSPEVVIISTGESFCFVPQAQLQSFYEKQVGVDIMATDAACRTYNLLASEGRKVVACLIVNA